MLQNSNSILNATILITIYLICTSCASTVQTQTSTWHVSTSGNDNSTGSKEEPLLTIEKAISLAQNAKGSKEIILDEGPYYDVHLSLSKKDKNLTIRAAQNAHPTLYGGVLIDQWQQDGHLWYTEIPGAKSGDWDFRTIEVDGQWRQRSRLPAIDAYTHLNKFDVRWLSSEAGGWERKPTTEELTTLKYKAADIAKNIDVNNAELTIYHEWDETLVGLKGHNKTANRLEFKNRSGHPPGAFAKRNPNAQTYVVWNTKEGMLSPGQWYLDRTKERLYYWPKDGEDISSTKIVVPKHNSIIQLEKGASHITIDGLTLASTTTKLITGGYAAARFEGAISGDRVNNITISNVLIHNVGGWGVKLKGERINITNSEIKYCGAGTINYRGSNVNITHNKLHDIGLIYQSAVGILGNGNNNLISHNEIWNMPYCGINGIGDNSLVDANVIHNIKTFMQDGGAVYMFGHKNTKVTNNVVLSDPNKHIKVYAYYLDEGCNRCTVSNNLAYNTSVPVQSHMTKNCNYSNNIFLDKGPQSIRYANASNMTFSKNILIAESIEFKGASEDSQQHAIEEGNKVMNSYASANGITNWANNLMHSSTGKINLIEMYQYSVFNDSALQPQEGSIIAEVALSGVEKGDFRDQSSVVIRQLDLVLNDFSNSGHESDLKKLIDRYYVDKNLK